MYVLGNQNVKQKYSHTYNMYKLTGLAHIELAWIFAIVVGDMTVANHKREMIHAFQYALNFSICKSKC
jgi:hypothetical protein